MNRKTNFDTSYLRALVGERLENGTFAKAIGVDEERLLRLFDGEVQFTHAQMIAAAITLDLDSNEFDRCFFTVGFGISK